MRLKTGFFTKAVSLCLIAGASTLAQAQGSGTSGGGAGCPQPDGYVITLLECGAPYQEPSVPMNHIPSPPPPSLISQPSEIPEGLNELIQFIQNFRFFSAIEKQRLINAIKPSPYRKYFQVESAPAVTQDIEKRIKAEFTRATGLKQNQLILYGLTDTNAYIPNSSLPAQITYLLPAFKKLRTLEEKMTALVHENYWVLFPHATYSQVVDQEINFEAAYQKPDRSLRLAEFVKGYFGVTLKAMQLYLKNDIETGAFNGIDGSSLFDRNGISSNYKLLGEDVIKCRAQDDYTCATLEKNHLQSLLHNYPRSAFLYYQNLQLQAITSEYENCAKEASWHERCQPDFSGYRRYTLSIDPHKRPTLLFWITNALYVQALSDIDETGFYYTQGNVTLRAVTDGSDGYLLR